jgi:two-component system response regulator (stage 0 sporulation protein A)
MTINLRSPHGNDTKTEQLLRHLGIRKNYRGYYYTLDSLMVVKDDPVVLTSITKTLYPVIAKRYGRTAAAIEHGIRTVINLAWEEGNRDLLQKLSGCQLLHRPSNAEFLAILADYMRVSTRMEEISRTTAKRQ